MDSFARDIFEALEELTGPEILIEGHVDVIIPTSILLPDPGGRRRAPFEDFARIYGIRFTSRQTIADMNHQIRRFFQNKGYRVDPNNPNLFRRARPLRLTPEVSESAPAPSSVELPDSIPLSMFSNPETMIQFARTHGIAGSIETARGRTSLREDINRYLVGRGYINNPAQQALVRLSGDATGPQLTSYRELTGIITPELVISEMSAPPLTVSQRSIFEFSITETELLRRIGGSWDLPAISQQFQIPLETVRFILTIFGLDRIPGTSLGVIDPTPGVDNRTHLQNIYDQLRQRIATQPRSYQVRSSFPGSLPTGSNNLSLELTLSAGYELTPRQKVEFSDLVDLLPSSRYVRFAIQVLRSYPEMVPGFFRFIMSARQLVTLPLVKLLYGKTETNRVEEIYAYLVGYPLILQDDPETAIRRTRLRSLPATYGPVLRQLYGTRNIDEILDRDPSVVEPYIFAIRASEPSQISELVSRMGMIIPPGMDPRRYALFDLARYIPILTRTLPLPDLGEIMRAPGTLGQFNDSLKFHTDSELLNFTGYIGGYSNRSELLANIYGCLIGESFFLLEAIKPERCVNTETTLLEKLEELLRPYLGFGTLLRYRIYSLDELNLAFSSDSEVNLRRPENPESIFRNEEMVSLRRLFPKLSENPDLAGLVRDIDRNITQGTAIRANLDSSTINVRRILHSTTDEIKTLVKDLFYDLFYVGMYMRRWQGPGNPYPYSEPETLNRQDPEPIVVLNLGKFSQNVELLRGQPGGMDVVDLLYTLRAVRLDQEIYSYTDYSLFRRAGVVAGGDYCIRMASLPFVISAYFYLINFFQETVPDVEIERLVAIQ